MISGIVFSKDRALQLDACLRSLIASCLDFDLLDLTVICRASQERFARQYSSLEKEYESLPGIHFMRERNFRGDLFQALVKNAGLKSSRLKLYNSTLSLPARLTRFLTPLIRLSPGSFALFLVDDDLFTRPFRLQEAVEALGSELRAIGFSLRLGKNTRHCYPSDREQPLPNFSPVGEGMLKFDWTIAEQDFHYPLEISSSIYRLELILSLLPGIQFHNPNSLESRMAVRAASLADRYPELLCFETSVAFSNPVNIVQSRDRNRGGQKIAYSPKWLAEQFQLGRRINILKYQSMIPNACHQEVPFEFIQWDLQKVEKNA